MRVKSAPISLTIFVLTGHEKGLSNFNKYRLGKVYCGKRNINCANIGWFCAKSYLIRVGYLLEKKTAKFPSHFIGNFLYRNSGIRI
jgi:hypothetical protein